MRTNFRHFVEALTIVGMLATGALADEPRPEQDAAATIGQIGETNTGSPMLVRGPYLQQGTPTSAIVRWQTDLPTISRVHYGLAVGQLTNTADDLILSTEHTVILTGLTPDTRYFYAIGSDAGVLAGDDADHHLTTSPILGTAAPVRIWAIGDAGFNSPSVRAMRDAYLGYVGDAPADVWLMLGDNAYVAGEEDEYQRAVFDMYPSILRTTMLWPTLGNHDGMSADSETQTGPYYDIFTLPTNAQAGGVASGTEAYYAFDYANIHFICLDSYGTGRESDGAMLSWLAQDLAGNTQPWVIAFWHHPPYSRGRSDSEVELIEMRENALPILESAGVDLVLGGHNHSYERSFLLDGHYGFSEAFDPSTMVLDAGDGQIAGDGAYTKPTLGQASNEGTVYVAAGSSGLAVSTAPPAHPAMHISLLDTVGSLVIDVEGARLDAVFLTNAGEILDSFTITKGLEVCLADMNGDGVLNFFDISEFLEAFAGNEPAADFTGDGFWNFFDIAAFLKAFAAGCP